MKKISILILLIFLIFPQIALADFSAVFEADPLFYEINIMPGDEYGKFIKIHNSDVGNRKVYIKAENYEDIDELGGKISLSIIKNSNNDSIYAGELKDFLQSDWLELPELSGDDEEQYDFKVEFDFGSGNEYQKTSLSFDIAIRSESDQGSCVCRHRCGHKWSWRHWHHWNNVVKHWFQKGGIKWWT